MYAIVSRYHPRLVLAASIVLTSVAGPALLTARSAWADPPPTISSATVDSANHLVVSWNVDGHRNPSVYWNTDQTLNPGAVAGGFVEGVPLACIWTAGGQTCTGHQAASTATTMISTNALAPGTYYVQVEDLFDGTSPSYWDDSWHYSNVAQVFVGSVPPSPPPDKPPAQLVFNAPGQLPGARSGRRYAGFAFCLPRPANGRTCGPRRAGQVRPRGGEGGPYYFGLKTGGGLLPPGMQLNTLTGFLSGTPRNYPGDYRFTVCVTDNGGPSSSHQTKCRTVRLRVTP